MMESVIAFERHTFAERLKTMLKVDFRRMFTQPLVYIMFGVSLLMPILILVMTTMMGGSADGGEAVGTFTNVWQAISSVSGQSSGMGMELTAMCNMNLIYFLAAVLICVFVADDFKSGYAKNLFTARAKKGDYVTSKTLAGFIGGACMLIFYFVGAMIGGAIAGLSFDAGVGTGQIAACLLSKAFLMAVFASIYLLLSVAAKQRLWLSLVASLAAGALLFMMIPVMTPLDSTFLNVILCLAGGVLFGAGLGVAGVIVLNKTSLV